MKLQQIGNKHQTDKSRHTYKNITYLDIYEKFFKHKREAVKNFVEIGVLNGASLRTWKDYFPNANIFGIDINPECKNLEEDRIKIFIGDQNDDDFLKTIKTEIPQIDILIDDGSHITKHQIKTFNYLFDNINKGGFYAIEDLRNSYEEFNGDLDLRSIWPGMKYNDIDDNLKNSRNDFNTWMIKNIKSMDFHDDNNRIYGIYNLPMIMLIETFE